MDSRNFDITLPWKGRAFLLVDLDAFFASVEQLDHPEWRDKPVIVGGDPERRGVVSTCSYEARCFGVHSAMSSVQAAKLCPNAIWTRGNFSRYAEVSQQVMEILKDESPLVEQISIDEAFVDITPGHFSSESPIAIANRIRTRVSELGVTCSVGIATNKTVAKIASDLEKPNGLTVVFPGTERSFLAALPVRTMSGIGAKTEQRLRLLGLETLGDVADCDDTIAKQIFGANGPAMKARCGGVDLREIALDDTVKSVSNEQTFPADLHELDDIKNAISILAAKVGRRLRRKGLAGYTVTLKIKDSDRLIHTAQKTLMSAVDDESIYTPVLHSLIDSVWRPGSGIRLIGVGISGFDERCAQLDLLSEIDNQDNSDQVPSRRSLIEATDKVKDRFGDDAVRFGRELRFKGRDTGTTPMKKDDYK